MDLTAKTPEPRAAKSVGAASVSISRHSPRGPAKLSSEVGPETFLTQIREHLDQLRYRAAQRLARKAAGRFPGHPEIRRMHQALNEWTARSRPASGRDTSEEFEWLENPPASARGKWVALVGSEAVALADTLIEVVASLKSMELPKTPLIHRLD